MLAPFTKTHSPSSTVLRFQSPSRVSTFPAWGLALGNRHIRTIPHCAYLFLFLSLYIQEPTHSIVKGPWELAGCHSRRAHSLVFQPVELTHISLIYDHTTWLGSTLSTWTTLASIGSQLCHSSERLRACFFLYLPTWHLWTSSVGSLPSFLPASCQLLAKRHTWRLLCYLILEEMTFISL